jgi:hypothetical protein
MSGFDQFALVRLRSGVNLPKFPFFGSDSEFGVGECFGDLSLAKFATGLSFRFAKLKKRERM